MLASARGDRKPCIDMSDQRSINYVQQLKQRPETEFLYYNPENGNWTFKCNIFLRIPLEKGGTVLLLHRVVNCAPRLQPRAHPPHHLCHPRSFESVEKHSSPGLLPFENVVSAP
jgi:hypothetical protein